MGTLLFVMILVVGYFSTSVAVARHMYAAGQTRTDYDKLRSVEEMLNKMKHGGSCYKNPSSDYYSRIQSCDCSLSNRWKALIAERSSLRVEVRGPYSYLFWWPFILFHRFLVGKELAPKSGYDPELTRMLEETCEIPKSDNE